MGGRSVGLGDDPDAAFSFFATTGCFFIAFSCEFGELIEEKRSSPGSGSHDITFQKEMLVVKSFFSCDL